jgi:membrane fusion protein
MATQLFRQEAIEAGRHRLVGTVVAAVPPGSRVYTIVAAAVGVGLVALLCFGSYSSRQQVRGVIAFDRGVTRVYPPAPAEIRTIHVRQGQRVAKGAPLLTISLSPGRDSSGEGMASQLAQIAHQDAELARQLELASDLSASERVALMQQRESAAAAIASLERQRSIARDQVALAESDSQRTARIAREGAGSKRQVEESRAALLARRAAIEGIEERLISQREALRGLDAEVEQKRIAALRTRSEIAGRRAALAEARAGLIRQDHLVLTAPVAGDVGEIIGQIGQRARPDASLVTIVPASSRLEAWLYAPSRAIGFVRPGQPVRLLLDAFPFQKYGAVPGRIVAVSRVATDPGAIDPGLELKEPVFRVRVRAEEGAMGAPADAGALRQGMTLSANIVLERRRLWEIFFEPVLAAVRA